mmetsp:Transcript_21106/g.58998  ORF Transcript_21106/g.58998 Transcript_21106/m.58998 type:complete len:284 (-) Transcript_21106:500-1351(-)
MDAWRKPRRCHPGSARPGEGHRQLWCRWLRPLWWGVPLWLRWRWIWSERFRPTWRRRPRLRRRFRSLWRRSSRGWWPCVPFAQPGASWCRPLWGCGAGTILRPCWRRTFGRRWRVRVVSRFAAPPVGLDDSAWWARFRPAGPSWRTGSVAAGPALLLRPAEQHTHREKGGSELGPGLLRLRKASRGAVWVLPMVRRTPVRARPSMQMWASDQQAHSAQRRKQHWQAILQLSTWYGSRVRLLRVGRRCAWQWRRVRAPKRWRGWRLRWTGRDPRSRQKWWRWQR